MAGYPDEDIEVTFRIAPGADLKANPNTWERLDLSSRLIQTPLTVSQGVVVGTGTSKTASATGIVCLNDDGELTPHHPGSSLWPYVDVGTPAELLIRTNTVPYLTDTFTRTVAAGNWNSSDNGLAWTGNANISVASGVGRISVPSVNNTTRTRVNLPLRDADITLTASVPVVATGATLRVVVDLRDDNTTGTFLGATLEFGLSGAVRLSLHKVTGGIFSPQGFVELPFTYSAGQQVSVRWQLIGDRLLGRAWLATNPEPSTWDFQPTLPAGYDAASVHTGLTCWVPAAYAGATPVVFSIDNITVQQPRYPKIEGYLTDVKPTFRKVDGNTHSVAQISIGGIGSRLEKRQADELSPMGRSIEKSTAPPIAYWRCEDKRGATSAASAFPSQQPLIPVGPAVFAFDLGVTDDQLISSYGTGALCSLAAGAKLSGPVPVSDTGSWTVGMEHWSLAASVGGSVTEMRLIEWATPGGTFQRWALVGAISGYYVRAYNDAAGTVTTVLSFTSAVVPWMSHYAVTATESGGNINVQWLLNDATMVSGSVAGTIAAVTRVTINPDQVNTTASVDPYGIKFVVGHVTVHDSVQQPLPYSYADGLLTRADRAWAYEYAWRRVIRLCQVEERVPLRVLGDLSTRAQMLNAQQPGSFTNLLKQAVESDSGSLLLEGEFGYLLDPRTSRYHRDVALTVDMLTYCYSKGTDPTEILVPKLDARGPNIWTVERTNGSQATYSADQTFLDRRGEVREKATLDVLYDSDTAQHAAFRTHLSVDGQGANYPNMTLDMAANPDLIDDWLTCRVGSRIQRTNQPVIAGLGVIDQIIDGITETIVPRQAGGPQWTATLDTSPAQVWDVGVYDGGYRYDSKTTTLASPVTSSSTILGLSVTDPNDTWTVTNTGFGIVCEGQTNTVVWMTNPGSISVAEGGFETGVTGWAANANGAVTSSTVQAHTGSKSALLTVTSSAGAATMFPTTYSPVTVGNAYDAWGWVYAPVALNPVRLFVSFYTAGAVFVSSVGGTSTPISAGVWTPLTIVGALAPATATQARVSVSIQVLSAPGTLLYVDDVDLAASGVLAGAGPYVQKAWVVRDPTVTKALSVGSPVHVANPARWAL